MILPRSQMITMPRSQKIINPRIQQMIIQRSQQGHTIILAIFILTVKVYLFFYQRHYAKSKC